MSGGLRMKNYCNIFKVENLAALSSAYCLYEIKGLKPSQKEYQSNKQFLIDKFSRALKHPVTIIEINGQANMVVKNDPAIISKINVEHDLGRIYIHLILQKDPFEIDFLNPSAEAKQICLRFLQFDLNGELRKNQNLWQPYAGGPFFEKEPEVQDGIAIFKGLTSRVIEMPGGGFGIVIDATRKFVSADPLPYYLPKDNFYKRFRKKSFLYLYNPWYEIQPQEYDDFNVSQLKVGTEKLIDYIRKVIPKPHSEQLANLPADSVALNYYANNGEVRAVPAGLLHEVLDFQDTNNATVNRKVLIKPQDRFKEIMHYRETYFEQLRFGQCKLSVARSMMEIKEAIRMGQPPIEMGNGTMIDPATYKNPKAFAVDRMNKLLNENIGFYSNSPLGNQFIVLPRSVNDTYGEFVVGRLKNAVDAMYPADRYDPEIISYEDKFKEGTDYVTIGQYIVDSVKKHFLSTNKKAFGVVMIPRFQKKSKREHDKLAALVIRKLRSLDLHISIIHIDTVGNVFESKRDSQSGKVIYKVKEELAKKFDGYIRNIAINKVLLNANKWPFILANPLKSGLVIGIDVKHHTAGFIIIDKYGKNIRSVVDETKNKEKLSTDQLKSILYKIVKEEVQLNGAENITSILITRDGRLFDTELAGLQEGLEVLKRENIIDLNCYLDIVEIPKTSFISLRFFEEYVHGNQSEIENPSNGFSLFINDELFTCTTGKQFIRNGSVNPLYVKLSHCRSRREYILQDIFDLCALAFSKPDDCSRYPISIKMNDVKLSNAASEYDEDAARAVEILLNDLKISTHE